MNKITSLTLSLALAVSLLAPSVSPVQAATYAEPSYNSPISVKLSEYSSPSVKFTVNGTYTVNGYNDLQLTNGNTYTIVNNNGFIEIWDANKTVKLYPVNSSITTTQIEIYPIRYNRSQWLHIGSYNYLGTFYFKASGSNILPINKLEQEDYLIGVVPYEMSNSWPYQALRAQAITARTYSSPDIGSSEVPDDPTYQVYKGYNSSYANTINAVDSTKGELIKYNGVSIGKNAFFSASNGGIELSKINSWGSASWNNVPYLVRRPDPYDASSGSPHENWNFSLDKYQLSLSGIDLTQPKDSTWWNSLSEKSYDTSKLNALKSFLGINGTKIVDISNLTFTDQTQQITSQTVLTGSITVDYLTFDGTYAKLNTVTKTTNAYNFYGGNAFGSNGSYPNFRSPNIKTALYDANAQKYTITGGGWGHGIGLSQWGANQMALDGKTGEDIVNYYYSDVAAATPVIYLNAPVVKISNFSNTKDTITGTYTNDQPANIQMILTGPNNYNQSLYTGNVPKGSSTIYGSITGLPGGTYTITITASANGKTSQVTQTFYKDPKVAITIPQFTSNSTTFSGTYSIDEDSNVQIHLKGQNVDKFFYNLPVKKGTYPFGGPLVSSLPDGTYTIDITASNGQTTSELTRSFDLKRSTPTAITFNSFAVKDGVYSGSYTIDKNSYVSIYLKDSKEVRTFTFQQQLAPGTYYFAGNLSNLPSGISSIIINARNDNNIYSTVGKDFAYNSVQSKAVTYTVQKGDTLWSISRKYNVSVSTLITNNRLQPYAVRVGQVLNIS